MSEGRGMQKTLHSAAWSLKLQEPISGGRSHFLTRRWTLSSGGKPMDLGLGGKLSSTKVTLFCNKEREQQEREHMCERKSESGLKARARLQTSLQKQTMSSHISLASPSSLCRSTSTSVLRFFAEAGAARSWALCSWAVWHARQCSAWALLMSVHAGQDHSALLGNAPAGKDEEGDSGDSSSFRMLRRLLARCSASADACGKASVAGKGLKVLVCLVQTSAGGTSLRLLGSGLFCLEELGVGYEASAATAPPPVAPESERWAGFSCRTPVCLQTSGTSRASAGIWGSESLRGPPQAEQDMEAGVFCRVHLKQSQVRLFLAVSSRWFCVCRLQGSVADALRGPERLLELWRSSPDELRVGCGVPV